MYAYSWIRIYELIGGGLFSKTEKELIARVLVRYICFFQLGPSHVCILLIYIREASCTVHIEQLAGTVSQSCTISGTINHGAGFDGAVYGTSALGRNGTTKRVEAGALCLNNKMSSLDFCPTPSFPFIFTLHNRRSRIFLELFLCIARSHSSYFTEMALGLQAF